MNDKDQRKNVLCDLVIKYPDVLSDIRLFKALILDYIPNDKLKKNLLIGCLEEDIPQEISSIKDISSQQMYRFEEKLAKAYGCNHMLANEVIEMWYEALKTSVYKGYKQDKIEMRGDRAEMSDFPLYLNTVAGGLDRRDQTIGGFSFVVKIYAVPVVEIIG